MRMKAETSECIEDLITYCQGNGLDLGYGGFPIKASAIAVDLPQPYETCGDYPQHLHGDATKLVWFKDCVFDYVFSSHLLEDFLLSEIPAVLIEWLRVIKPGGSLVLYMPDQKRYEAYCKDHNEESNPGHKNPDMSLDTMIGAFNTVANCEIIHQKDNCGKYSFQIVARRL